MGWTEERCVLPPLPLMLPGSQLGSRAGSQTSLRLMQRSGGCCLGSPVPGGAKLALGLPSSLLRASLAPGRGSAAHTSCPGGPQLLQLHAWGVSERPASNLSWLRVCGPNPPRVGSYRLTAAGRRAPPEISWHSWAIPGLKSGWRVTHLCLTGESRACGK